MVDVCSVVLFLGHPKRLLYAFTIPEIPRCLRELIQIQWVVVLDSDACLELLCEPFCPLLLPPRARNLGYNDAVEKDGRRDVDAVLPAELDYNSIRWVTRFTTEEERKLTGIFQVVSYSDTSVWR